MKAAKRPSAANRPNDPQRRRPRSGQRPLSGLCGASRTESYRLPGSEEFGPKYSDYPRGWVMSGWADGRVGGWRDPTKRKVFFEVYMKNPAFSFPELCRIFYGGLLLHFLSGLSCIFFIYGFQEVDSGPELGPKIFSSGRKKVFFCFSGCFELVSLFVPNLGPNLEVVSHFGPNIGIHLSPPRRFGPKFGPTCGACVSFFPKYGHNSGACVSFRTISGPKSGACVIF